MKFTVAVSSIILPLLAFVSSGNAEPPQTATIKAPLLGNSQTTENKDLGTWDDVFVCDERDFMVVRRGEQMFSLSMTGAGNPKKLVALPALKKSRIIASAGSGESLWLFLESSETEPFALEINSGKVSSFRVPRPKVFKDGGGTIQSHIIVRQSNAALLMVSGGAAWPRDGNRPVYFWMSLKSGKVVILPVGWDLEYFSANQKVAVFGKTLNKEFDKRPLQAVDVETGEMLTEIPSRQDVGTVPFNWTETQIVKPLYLRRRNTGDEDYFGGISFNGSIFPFPANIDFGRTYLSTAKANDGFAGFRLRRAGATDGEPSPFWVSQLKPKQNPKLIAAKVTDFAMLNEGNCVFATAGDGHKGAYSEAFFRVADKNATWNVLDEIERLPELDKEFVDKNYVEDKMTIRLIESFGQQHDPLILCLFKHFRRDMRSFTDFNLREQPKTLETVTWRRALVLTSRGQRYMTSLFREGNDPDYIWLHNSGKVITGTISWVSPNPDGDRKIHLSETILTLP